MNVTADFLEQNYEPREIVVLLEAKRSLDAISDPVRRNALGRQVLTRLWPDPLQRLQKTAWIQKKDGPPGLLRLNHAQLRFWNDVIEPAAQANRPVRAIILKARQLGFSTLIQCYQHGECYWNANRNALTISYDEDSTEELFAKTRFCDDSMWFAREKKRARGTTIEFAIPHNSTFYTRTAGNVNAGRGLTFHRLHCSEIPMWPDPETVLTAAQQAVPAKPGTSIIYESTARGAVGLFYDEWNSAVAGESDFYPFFAPWFWDPEYRLEFESPPKRNEFMQALSGPDREYRERFGLTAEQMHWREWIIRNQLNGNRMMFRQEYPACAEEAFLTTGSPVFDPESILRMSAAVAPPLFIGHAMLQAGTNVADE